MAEVDGHGCVRALQLLFVWAGGQTLSGIFSFFHMATTLVKPYFPHSERFGNANSLLFHFFSSVLPADLNSCLSLGSLLSFLEDSLASNYENVDANLSTGLVHTFLQSGQQHPGV